MYNKFDYLWNQFINDVNQVPEGIVDILHWKAVVKADSKLQIKVCSKLTEDHVQPRHFQTMNDRMAFQV